MNSTRHTLLITGIAGLLASILVGVGEFLLHYDPLARFSSSHYDYLIGISTTRTTFGHFLAVIGATLYPIGCYHIYLMLRRANLFWSRCAFLIGSFGFIVGAVWIGSRANISAIIQLQSTTDLSALIDLYAVRYESLLHIVRISILLVSIIIVALGWSGRSLYPKWIGVFNPIFLILINFLIFAIVPSVGRYTMPIALNISFFIFFSLSIIVVLKLQHTESPEHQ